MIPVVSDFLMEDPKPLLEECRALNAMHDVFIALIDSAFAFELPDVSAGWVEGYDVETGRTRVLSAGDLRQLGGDVRRWQDSVETQARSRGLDVVRVSPEGEHAALADFLAARRISKR